MTKSISRRSDLEIEVIFIDKQTREEIPVPGYDFEISYFVFDDRLRSAGQKDGILSENCKIIDGRLHIFLDKPDFGCGRLRRRHCMSIPHPDFPDKIMTYVKEGAMDVMIVDQDDCYSSEPMLTDEVLTEDYATIELLATEDSKFITTEDGIKIFLCKDYGIGKLESQKPISSLPEETESLEGYYTVGYKEEDGEKVSKKANLGFIQQAAKKMDAAVLYDRKQELTNEQKQQVRENIGLTYPYMSIDRLRHYLYRVTFDNLPEDNGGGLPAIGGCSSYIKDGKLHTNLDWDYDNTASFIVRTRDFEGQGFIKGLDDGNLDDALIAQLPYRVHRGVNDYGISLASHILFNDWQWTGTGEKSINLTRLPFLVLSRVKSMATIDQDLAGVLDNLYCPEGLAQLGYLLQIIVTDGTTTYAIVPPLNEGEPFELVDATEFPKMTNFRYIARAEVSRYDMDLQDRPTGVERFNAMPCDLKDLRFTKAYEQPTRLTEFIGLRGTTKASSDEELLEIYNLARAEYLQRQRDGKTWQTMESAIYGRKLESLWIQENWDDDCMDSTDIQEATDDDIDALFD